VAWRRSLGGGLLSNREQALAFMRQSEVIAGGRFELVDVVGVDDKVVVIMRSAAQEDQPGSLSADLTTFRDGKVIEMVHYPDPDDALAAVGADRDR